MPTAIKVENISKAYQLGEIGTGTLSRDLERWISRIRGREDPFLRIGETNDRTSKGSSGVVWSLKDISFDIEQGDAVGIIGRNGAGKSTLLKILSRVTSPTTGKIIGKGRIASLLEVGTGFHPELTGRENIYLNGAILGMRRKEISRKFDEIVVFAGIERYVDTPVKRYSSGMYVRLAFAVAAYLESEILIVDEVLAVGDSEFQKKCLGKMGEVSNTEGRTILFVSHNMNAVSNLCKKSILLKEGSVENIGNTREIINKYLNNVNKSTGIWKRQIPKNEIASIVEVWLTKNNQIVNNLSTSDRNYINITIEIINPEQIKTIAFEIKSIEDISLFCSHDFDVCKLEFKKGTNHYKIEIPSYLRPGSYYINIGSNSMNFTTIDYLVSVLNFELIAGMNYANDSRPGSLLIPIEWKSV